MIKNSPDPVDVQDILFKLHCKLKVFNNEDIGSFRNPHNLITCASRYGLLFVGGPATNFQVIPVSSLENFTPKDKEISNYPKRNISLPSCPKHLCVNCDSTILAVVVEKEKCPATLFYDVLSFYQENVSIIKELRLSANPETYVCEVNWNPSLPGIFTACKSDGSLGVYEIKDNSIDINDLPPAAEVTSFCWSPKGKQIAVGSKSGKIVQYKPDLKAVKEINAPPLEETHSLISLQWISNYQFLGIFQSSNPDGTAKLIVIDAPKTGETKFTNYDDVCYSGSGRIPQFFIIFQQQWNLVMIASSNSTEVAVLGLNHPETWTQWILSDSARAELPLNSERQETFPVGLTFDISNTKPFPWGESTIPPCPYLLILSHQGVLCVFNVVNLKELPSLCTPPDPVKDIGDLKLFLTTDQISTERTEMSKNVTSPPSFQQSKPTLPTSPVTSLTQSKQSAFVPPTAQNILEQNVFSNLQSTPAVVQASRPPQPQSLCGGQATIIPIKPQISNKPAENVTLHKYTSLFSSLNVPVTPLTFEPPKPTEVSFIPPKTLKNIAPTKEVIVQPRSKLVDTEKADVDALLGTMIQEECISVESELNALLHKGRAIAITIGTEEEKLDLISSVKVLEEFIKEIVDVSLGEIAEVHALKQNLVLSWAWYEEALSHYNASKNKNMEMLIRSRPLDSATEKRYNEIKKLNYYIESQLQQVSKELDEQWDKFQAQVKKIYQIQMPTMEAIFQTMVRQGGILQKQIYIMKDISLRLKHKIKPLQSSALLVSKDTTNNIETALKQLQLVPEDNRRNIFENINSHSKTFTKTKMKKLRNLLRDRQVTHVTVVKPQLSPLNKQMLAAKMSPLLRESSRNKLDFSTLSSSSVNTQPPKIQMQVPAIAANTNFLPSNSTAFAHINPNAFTIINVGAANSEKNFASTTSNVASLPSNAQTTIMSKSSQCASNSPVATIKQSVAPPAKSRISFRQAPVASSATTVSGPKMSFTNQPATVSSSFSFASPAPLFSYLSKPTTSMFSDVCSTSNTATNKPAFRFESKPTEVSTTAALTNIFGFATTPAQTGSIPNFSMSKTATTTALATTNLSSVSQNLPIITSKNLVTSPITIGKPIFGSPSPLFNASSTISSSTSNVVTVAVSKTPEVAKPITTAASTNLITTQPKTTSKVTDTSASSLTSTVTLSSTTTTLASSLFGGTSLTLTSSTPTTTTVTTSKTPVFKTGTSTPVTNSMFGLANPTTIPSSVSLPVQSTISATATCTDTPLTTSVFSFISTSTNSASTIGQPVSTIAESKASDTINSILNQPATTTESIFEQIKPSTASSLFGQATPMTATSIFGNPTIITTVSSIFKQSTTTTTSMANSIFGQCTTTASTASSIFGQPTTKASTASSIFEQPTATTSTTSFGQPITPVCTANSVFKQGMPTTTVSLFVQPATTATITGSIFGQTVPTTSSIFGQAVPTTSSIFGQAVATTSSIFGQAVPTTTSSLFGQATTPSSSVFGQKSIFGQTTPATTTNSVFVQANSTFGQPTPDSTSSIFGQAATTTTSSIFGQIGSSATTPIFQQSTASNSVFGQTATTTTSSVFGSTTTNSVFGQTTKTTPSIFGQTAPTFGQTTATSTFGSTSSPFGQTTQQNSVFGQTTSSSIFGQPSSFGTNSTEAFNTATTAPSIFGTNTSTGPATFGTNASNTFGSSAPFTSNTGTPVSSFSFGSLNLGNSVFGTNNAAAPNPFAGGSIFGTTSPSSTTSSIFGANTSSTSASIFGSSTPSTAASIFGSKPSTFGSNTQPGFGPSTFGSNSTFSQQSSFGPTSFGNTSFSNPQTPSGPFSSGGTGVGQTGFGSPTNFAKSPGFGTAPVFGGSPAFGGNPNFGGNPTFGGAPAFGAAPSFGSPNKVFGSNTPTAAFGSPNAASPNFGNLANQNPLSFGNLAQQQANSSSSTPFSGSSSFSSWR